MDFYESFKISNEPIKQLDTWIKEAIDKNIPLPHAMNLSTVGPSGQPSSRIVLLKSLSNEGLVFFSDYLSQKGEEIALNDRVSVTFWWAKTDKQIRVEGRCSKTTYDHSDKYFNSRPKDSKISASISFQSKKIESYEFLMEKAEDFRLHHEGKEIRRPERWGGYVLKPEKVEFWLNKSNRLHKREVFKLAFGNWKKYLISP